MWKSACVGVYQLLNWKMHGETLKCVFYVLLFLSSTWWWTYGPKHVGEKNIINCCVLTVFVVVLTSWRPFSMHYSSVLFRSMVMYLNVLFPRLWSICNMIGFSFLTWQDKERKKVWWGQHVYWYICECCRVRLLKIITYSNPSPQKK